MSSFDEQASKGDHPVETHFDDEAIDADGYTLHDGILRKKQAPGGHTMDAFKSLALKARSDERTANRWGDYAHTYGTASLLPPTIPAMPVPQAVPVVKAVAMMPVPTFLPMDKRDRPVQTTVTMSPEEFKQSIPGADDSYDEHWHIAAPTSGHISMSPDEFQPPAVPVKVAMSPKEFIPPAAAPADHEWKPFPRSLPRMPTTYRGEDGEFLPLNVKYPYPYEAVDV